MTTLTNGDKSIQISMKYVVCDATKEDNCTISYIVKGPEIICNNKEDAEYIQEKLNLEAMSICTEILNNQKGETNE